ncbi:MAG: winged helix DNA-binding protein [Fimbriimonadaceae bacterium]|nr:winged helix DNA-binding protein [Fimbriimonadaceae bacterium]QYK56963.1 MAG: winged helix DNA-binding protein [Fimbriimonadaceae bacterium]
MSAPLRYVDRMPSEQIGTRIAAVYELQSSWLEPRLAEIGVGWNTFQLLTTIDAAGSDASQVEVARRLGVTPATLSETVFGHVRKGLLEQVVSERDRRVKLLRLTDQSQKLVRQIRKLVTESEQVMVEGLSDSEIGMMVGLLERVIANLEGTRRK